MTLGRWDQLPAAEDREPRKSFSRIFSRRAARTLVARNSRSPALHVAFPRRLLAQRIQFRQGRPSWTHSPFRGIGAGQDCSDCVEA
jgi:hypothetical protein